MYIYIYIYICVMFNLLVRTVLTCGNCYYYDII